MTAGEELWGHFYTGDRDRDLAWDTQEWIHHLNNNTERRKSDKMRSVILLNYTVLFKLFLKHKKMEETISDYSLFC